MLSEYGLIALFVQADELDDQLCGQERQLGVRLANQQRITNRSYDDSDP